MNATKTIVAALSASALGLCFAMPAHAQSIRDLPLNQPTDVNNVQLACTGLGDREEQNARWDSYPVKLETVGDHGEYLAGEKVTLRGHDGQMIKVKCDAPWVLMKLEPGRYSATVQSPNGAIKKISVRVPDNRAQRDVIVRFPQQSARNDNSNGIMLPSGAS